MIYVGTESWQEAKKEYLVVNIFVIMEQRIELAPL